MDEQEVLEQEQEEQQTTTTTQQQEQQTTTTTTAQPEQSITTTSALAYEPLADNSENIIHELFAELGVNLDYTPTSPYQCFTMALQFLAAIWFIWWFVKFLFKLLVSFLSGKAV